MIPDHRESLLAPDTSVLARKLSFSDVSADEMPMGTIAAPEKLKVFVRARPLAAGEVASDMSLTESAVSIRTVKNSAQGRDSVEEASFSFDTVFGQKATQEQVFESAMLPQVKSLFTGRDTLTFAYGITNAGKTYTIQGRGDSDEMGALPRALQATFVALEAHRARKAALAEGADAAPPQAVSGAAGLLELEDECSYEVRASFLEVYGNDAFDLLALPSDNASNKLNAQLPPGAQPKRVPLRLKEDKGQVFVEGLKEVELPDFESATRAVQLGWTQRAQATNGINDESSRSHAVLCLKLLTRKPGMDAKAPPQITRLCVVDLAGAERQKKTQADGKRLDEAKTINKDLMVLGHCLRDLRYNQLHSKGTQKVPPFRDSRITMLFRDYLSGNGQISVIAALSPRSLDAGGTLDTLRFAAIAQQVKIVTATQPPSNKKDAPLPSCAVPGQRAVVDKGAAGAGLKGPRPAGASNAHAHANAAGARVSATDGVSERTSAGDWGAASAEIEAENLALREQVVALQGRLLAHEADKMTMEREIREEVAAEMKEHLESTEAEMKERLEMERHNTEEMYHKKLALVKTNTDKRADAASVAAHTEILQQTRDNQRREAEHAAQVRRLEEQLDARRVELEDAKVELEALQAAAPKAQSAAIDAQSAAAAAAGDLASERTERVRLEAELGESEAARAQACAQVETLEFQLHSEREAKAGLQSQINELQGRLSNVIELSKQGRRKSTKATSSKAAIKEAEENWASLDRAEPPSPAKRALGEATNMQNEDAPNSADDSPKRSRLSRRLRGASLMLGGGASNERHSQGHGLEAEGSTVLDAVPESKAAKPSKMMGKMMRTMMGGKKGGAVLEDTSQVYLEVGGGGMPEPTPIARRTRAGRAAA